MATYTNVELQHITTQPLAPPSTPVETSLESTPPQHIFINTGPPVHAEYVPMDWGTRIIDPTPQVTDQVQIPQVYRTPPQITENPASSAPRVQPPIQRTPRRAISARHRAPQRSRSTRYAPPFHRRSYWAPASHLSSNRFEYCLLLLAFLLGICLFIFIVTVTLYLIFKRN